MHRLLGIVILLAVLTSGCGLVMRIKAGWSGYTKLCIDGASWVFIHGDYAQQQLGLDGKPVACGK